MKDEHLEDIKALFERFADAEKAQTAAEDIRKGDELFGAYPTPSPAPDALHRIRANMLVELSKKHRYAKLYRYFGAAAAIIIIALVGLFGNGPKRDPGRVNHASLLPASIWESDDIASDDAELAYFRSEIDRIEARIDALRSGDDDTIESSAIDEIEIELRLLETQFWKE